MTDKQLLEEIIESRSPSSFTALVDRYIGLVYSAAMRQVEDGALAEDITQAVFLMIWQRADKVGNPSALAGWLVNATRFAARAAVRAERRLKKREIVAATLKPGEAMNRADEAEDIAPFLDKALGQLGQTDRAAVTLRFLQEKSLGEIAEIMGISAATASKRISRAIGRLRVCLSDEGCPVQLTALPAALGKQSIAVPDALSSKVAAITSTATSSAVGAIAQGAIRIVRTETKFVASMIVFSTILLMAAGAIWEGRLFFEGRAPASSPVSINTTPSDVAGRTIGPPIKVGVILSYRTGVEKGWTGSPYGFGVQMNVLGELRDPNFKIIPIVETGTESKGPMPGQLARYFGATRPIDGGNAAELEKLDVIVASATWRTTDAVVDAVEEAVTNGVGLINGAGMGVEGPEYAPDHPAVAHVAGLIEGQYGWNSNVVACRVLRQDPLLGTLTANSIAHLAPNGAYGILPPYAKPLIGLSNPGQAWGAGSNLSDDPRYVFYPLYVSSLGRGRIVGCQFAPYMAMPQELQRATGGKFYIRCVRWLAGRPLQ